MDPSHVIATLVAGTGLGLLHALDPDHVAAVAGLSHAKAGPSEPVKHCLRWALGHGVALVAVGAGVALFDAAIPQALSTVAEHAVGGVLVAIGLWILWDPVHRRLHRRGRAPRTPGGDRREVWRSLHARPSVGVGLLHGLAGSAPALGLIPIAAFSAPALALGYLAVFGLGVVAAMLAFGLTFGWLSRRLTAMWASAAVALRSASAAAAMGVGGVMLVGAATHG